MPWGLKVPVHFSLRHFVLSMTVVDQDFSPPSKMPSLLYGPWIHLLQVQKIIQHFCLLHINALTKLLVMPCILKEEKTAITNCKTVESRAHCQQRFSIGLRISAQMLNFLAPHKYKLSQQISFFVSQCDFS